MKMDTEKRKVLIAVSICVSLWLLLAACGKNSTALPSLTLSPALPTVTPLASPPPAAPVSTPSCIDGLSFLDDVTIPDYTVVAPGSGLDKQWLVQNSGSCNWDSRYRLRLISGEALGAVTEQALYPARAGMQATLRILFTAPQEAGEYVSEWQAYNPQGQAFGETVFIKIIVQP